jgi:hypothetical protein
MFKDSRYASLPRILKEFGTSRRIIAGVILTYEFDPMLALSLARTELLRFDADPTDGCLRFKGAFPACLFHDPKRSRNEVTFPGDFEIHYKAKTGVACHHSKAYAFAHSDGTFTLVFGSLNLTEPGLLTNRETLLVFTLDDDSQTCVRKLFVQWLDFLEQNYQSNAPAASLKNYLDLLNRKLEAIRSTIDNDDEESSLQLISSGYDSPSPSGLKQLKDFCRDQGVEPTRLLVVSPFFDHDPKRKNVLKDFKDAFPKLEAVSIFSTFEEWGETFFECFEKDGVRPLENSLIRCFQIPKAISEAEAKSIDRFLGGESKLNIDKLSKLTRELHAKVVLLCDKSGRRVLYIGSANFSTKAWQGENFELGVAGVLPEGPLPEDWDRRFVKNLLYVESQKLRLKPEDLKLSSDPAEDESAPSPIPAWLESVLLRYTRSEEQSADEICGEFCFYLRRDGNLPELKELDKLFKFGSTPITFRSKDSNGDCLVSNVLHFQKPQLESCRVIEKKKDKDDRTDPDYIPFNVDYEFGLQTEYRLLIKPEHGLQFLGQLCIPRVLEKHAQNFTDSKKEFLDRLYERCSRQTNNDEIYSKTHVMRKWITDLGNLEEALIDWDNEKNTDKLRVEPLSSEFFTMLLAHANVLKTLNTFEGHKLLGSDKAFMLMELAILASRVGAQVVKIKKLAPYNQNHDASTESELLKIKQSVKALKIAALTLESENPPDFSGNQDLYRDLLETVYKKFEFLCEGDGSDDQ